MKCIEILKKVKKRLYISRILKLDIKNYKDCFSNSYQNKKMGNKAARDIIVFCHVVEKGLSHKNLKPLFGYDKVLLIKNALVEYIQCGGNDLFVIEMAVNILKKYNDINVTMGVDEEKLIKIPSTIDLEHDLDVGVNEISISEFFGESRQSFSKMCKSRRSVRLYDAISDEVIIDELYECVKIAQNSPSACNRQAVRVKIVTDKKLISEIVDIQGGASGFGEHAGALMMITSDLSLYEPEERRIPMLDCGLFMMSLVYALFEKKYGTCILNGSFLPDKERMLDDLIGRNNNEMYAAIIAISKMKDEETIMVAKSAKRDVNDIVTVI